MYGRIIIKSDIKIITGLHIGGSTTSVDIGGIDNSVIKTHKGEPYIPGSSLKGKLRSLSELAYNKGQGKACNCKKDDCFICKIYGTSADSKNKTTNGNKVYSTRIIVRDSFLRRDIAEKMREKKDDFRDLEFTYTESKWENTIDRFSSYANPRVIERVPEGVVFESEVIYTFYDEDDIKNFKHVIEAYKFLQDDYLGGNGTRGYGKVEFENIKITYKTINNYTEQPVGTFRSIDEINKEFYDKLNKTLEDKKDEKNNTKF